MASVTRQPFRRRAFCTSELAELITQIIPDGEVIRVQFGSQFSAFFSVVFRDSIAPVFENDACR